MRSLLRLQENLSHLGSFGLGEAEMVADGGYDAGFGKGQGGRLFGLSAFMALSGLVCQVFGKHTPGLLLL